MEGLLSAYLTRNHIKKLIDNETSKDDNCEPAINAVLALHHAVSQVSGEDYIDTIGGIH